MERIWKDLYAAARAVLNPRKVSEMMEAGGVAAAIEAESGKIYVGVCVDTACTLGVCAIPFIKAVEEIPIAHGQLIKIAEHGKIFSLHHSHFLFPVGFDVSSIPDFAETINLSACICSRPAGETTGTEQKGKRRD